MSSTLPSAHQIQECHVRVAPSKTAGNGLFATKDIEAGSTIVIAARPLLGELDLPRLEDTCANCFRWANNGEAETGEPLIVSACSGCKKVRYCSKTCQKQAWGRTHKYECKLLRDPALPPLPSSVRAALQLTAYMAGKNVPEEDKAAVRRLQSHDASTYTQLNEVEQFEINVQAVKDVFERLSPGDSEASQIQEYVGKILRNSLTLTTPTLDPLGLAFDPLICTANHSCDPNAIVLFDNPRLLLRSLSPIPKGTEITISYIDTTNPLDLRQHDLRTRYCFTCQCPKCHDQKSAIASKNDPAIPTFSFQLLDVARTQDSATAISTLQNLLRTFSHADTTSQPLLSARLEIIPHLLATNRLGLAIRHLSKLYFDIDTVLFEKRWHPIRVVHIWVTIRTLLAAYQMPQDPNREVDPGVKDMFERGFDFMVVVLRLLEEVAGLVGKSHGTASSVGRMIGGLRAEIEMGVGREGMQALRRDPMGIWGMFRGLGGEVD